MKTPLKCNFWKANGIVGQWVYFWTWRLGVIVGGWDRLRVRSGVHNNITGRIQDLLPCLRGLDWIVCICIASRDEWPHVVLMIKTTSAQRLVLTQCCFSVGTRLWTMPSIKTTLRQCSFFGDCTSHYAHGFSSVPRDTMLWSIRNCPAIVIHAGSTLAQRTDSNQYVVLEPSATNSSTRRTRKHVHVCKAMHRIRSL